VKKTVSHLLYGVLLAGLAIPMGILAAFGQDSSQASPSPEQPRIEDAGNATDVPPVEEVKILRPGDFDAAYNAYRIGNYKTALDLATKRAEIGDPAAMTLLAILYMEGRAIMQDSQRSAHWFSRAAEAGDPKAALSYGISLYNGFNVPKDIKRGEEFVKKAVDAGVPAAFNFYGQMMMENAPREDRYDVGLVWFLRGAMAGDADCAYNVAQILEEGTAKVPSNLSAARAMLEVAAFGGSVSAQMDLASWMIEGRGGPRNFEAALTWMKTLAVKGIAPAQVALARLYRDGIGTKRDTIMAAAWHMQAQQYDINVRGIDTADLDLMMEGMSAAQIAQAQERVKTLLSNP